MSDQPIITLPASGSSINSLQPIDDMINKVAGMVGQPDDPDARSLAISALDDAAGQLNLAGTYLVGLREFSFSPAADVSSAPLPPNWGWPFGLGRIADENGVLKQYVQWVPWDTFWTYQINRLVATSLPQMASIKNEAQDGQLYMYPTPTAAHIGYTFTFPYLSRVQRISETSQLYMTDELRTVLVTGGKAFIAMHRYMATPDIWKPIMQLFQQQIVQFRGAGDRTQAGDTFVNFQLDVPFAYIPRTYIKFGEP